MAVKMKSTSWIWIPLRLKLPSFRQRTSARTPVSPNESSLETWLLKPIKFYSRSSQLQSMYRKLTRKYKRRGVLFSRCENISIKLISLLLLETKIFNRLVQTCKSYLVIKIEQVISRKFRFFKIRKAKRMLNRE